MSDPKTTIDGYTVEMMLWTEGNEQRSSCHISKRINGTLYCSSLDAVMGDGGEFEEAGKPMSQATCDKIEAWALKNGY